MLAIITHNPDAVTHQWNVTVFDQGRFVFGVAVDATTEEEVRAKVKRLVDSYIQQ